MLTFEDKQFLEFEEIPLFTYDLVMADPPWLFECRTGRGYHKSAQNHYDCMRIEDIKALPVGNLVGPHSLLWLWAINPMLDLALDVLRAWGFKFKTAGHWAKIGKSGKQHFGPGYILRGAGEPFLIGTIGSPKTISNSVRSVVVAPVRDHSRKPDEAYNACEALMPSARKLDLFSRQRRAGWDVFGNEWDKFEGSGDG